MQNPAISRHIWIYYADAGIFRILALPVQIMYNQHLLFKSGFSFKSLFISI